MILVSSDSIAPIVYMTRSFLVLRCGTQQAYFFHNRLNTTTYLYVFAIWERNKINTFKVLLEKATLKKRPPYFSMVIGKCPGASGGSDSEPKPRLELFL